MKILSKDSNDIELKIDDEKLFMLQLRITKMIKDNIRTNKLKNEELNKKIFSLLERELSDED